MSYRRFDSQQHRAYRAEDAVRDTDSVLVDSRGTVECRLPRAALVLAPFADWRFIGVPNTTQRQRCIARCRGLVNRVIVSPWWREMGGPRDVTCKVADRYARSSRGGLYGHGYGIVLAGTPGHCSGLVIAHELAHVLDRKLNGHGVEGHGPTWVGGYLGLTELILGAEMRSELAISFVNHDVRSDTTWLVPGTRALAESTPVLPKMAHYAGWDWIAPRPVVVERQWADVAAKPTGEAEQGSLW